MQLLLDVVELFDVNEVLGKHVEQLHGIEINGILLKLNEKHCRFERCLGTGDVDVSHPNVRLVGLYIKHVLNGHANHVNCKENKRVGQVRVMLDGRHSRIEANFVDNDALSFMLEEVAANAFRTFLVRYKGNELAATYVNLVEDFACLGVRSPGLFT